MILLVFLLLYIVYHKAYFKKQNDFKIIQTTLANISQDILLERYPIYIKEKIVTVDDLKKTVFKYDYVSCKYKMSQLHTEEKTVAKYTIIHNTYEKNIRIELKNTNDYIDLIIEPYNVVVLPLGWSYKTRERYLLHELYDMMHIFKSIIG
jgi:hypothetical protein